jgi:signal transduction histidine kinase
MMAANSASDLPIDQALLTAYEHENTRLRGDLRTIGRRLAHDLRTPLNSISMAGEALRHPGLLGQSLESVADSIASAVAEASTLVERLTPVLLATATAELPQPVKMEEIVRDTLQRAESRVLRAAATVKCPATWPPAVGVTPWLELVWLNLILNSLQHGGAKVNIQLGADATGDSTRFWIRDSGHGIPAEKQRRLFHPLDRLSELNAPRNYGLSIVHRLVHLQGGTCGYDPRPAPGGTFFFTLPAR